MTAPPPRAIDRVLEEHAGNAAVRAAHQIAQAVLDGFSKAEQLVTVLRDQLPEAAAWSALDTIRERMAEEDRDAALELEEIARLPR